MSSITPPRPSDDKWDSVLAITEECFNEIARIAKAPEKPGKFPDPATLDPIDRRVLVRSIGASVEATSFAMKALALEWDDDERLTPAERMLAADREPRVTDTGTVIERSTRLPTLSNARFAFKVLAKVVDSPYQLDVTGKGWLTLQDAMATRDRLMHPKTLDDLTVTDLQIRDVLRAYKWFHEQVVILLGSLARSLERQVATERAQAHRKAGRTRRPPKHK